MAATTKVDVFDYGEYTKEQIENWDLDAQPVGCSITSPSKIFNKSPFVGSLDNGRAQVFFFFFFM